MSQYKNRSNLSKSFNLLSNPNSLVQARQKTAEDILCNNKIFPESISLQISMCTAVQSFLHLSSIIKWKPMVNSWVRLSVQWPANRHWQSKEKYIPKFSLGPLNKHEISSLMNIQSSWQLKLHGPERKLHRQLVISTFLLASTISPLRNPSYFAVYLFWILGINFCFYDGIFYLVFHPEDYK